MTVMLAAADVIRLVGANVGFRHSLIESGLSAYDNIAAIDFRYINVAIESDGPLSLIPGECPAMIICLCAGGNYEDSLYDGVADRIRDSG